MEKLCHKYVMNGLKCDMNGKEINYNRIPVI